MTAAEVLELSGYLLICWVTGFGGGILYMTLARFFEQI